MTPTESTDERDGERPRRTHRPVYGAIAALAGVLLGTAPVFARDVTVRRTSPAVDFCCTRIQTRLYGNRAFVEGSVANGAAVAVHNVRVCIKGECDYTTPSTLQPGSQATFRVPAKLERYMSGPDYRITWEVITRGGE